MVTIILLPVMLVGGLASYGPAEDASRKTKHRRWVRDAGGGQERRAAGDVCRPAATACDRAEVCDGISRACPPDVSKAPGDGCDDGDPATGTSSCDQALECRGVVGTVTVAPEIVVPSTESPKQVKIPVMVDVPATPGTKQATVVLQGVVDCRDVPSALRPKQCGSVAGAVTAGTRRGSSRCSCA